jgi:hypothetical protein
MYDGPQRIVFFVGPDMCGKTNIAQALSRATGIPYFKASSEHDAYLSSKVSKRELFNNQLRYADPRVCDLLKQTGQSVVFDRGFPCEYVYSRVMGRQSDTQMLLHLDREWANLGAWVILCYRTSYLGIVDDLDPNITSHKLDALSAEYFDFAKRITKCRTYALCVDDEDLQRELGDVYKALGLSKP